MSAMGSFRNACAYLAVLAAALACAPAAAQPQKVLRYAFEIAETNFDPTRSATSTRTS